VGRRDTAVMDRSKGAASNSTIPFALAADLAIYPSSMETGMWARVSRGPDGLIRRCGQRHRWRSADEHWQLSRLSARFSRVGATRLGQGTIRQSPRAAPRVLAPVPAPRLDFKRTAIRGTVYPGNRDRRCASARRQGKVAIESPPTSWRCGDNSTARWSTVQRETEGGLYAEAVVIEGPRTHAEQPGEVTFQIREPGCPTC